MAKNTKDEIISILDELISYCEKTNKNSMRDVCVGINDELKKGKISSDRKDKLCKYFCGYHAHADLAEYEYVRVQKIIDFFWI